eukprot:3299768-Rhodomonas_salina.7
MLIEGQASEMMPGDRLGELRVRDRTVGYRESVLVAISSGCSRVSEGSSVPVGTSPARGLGPERVLRQRQTARYSHPGNGGLQCCVGGTPGGLHDRFPANR